MEWIISIFLGIGLAAAVGFRIFLPFLVVNLAAQWDLLELASGFEWMGSKPALILFATASLLEVLAYFIPWFDNLLDVITAPAAMICGTLMMASIMVDMAPWIRWTLAVIAGGGTAGLIKGTSTATRAVTSITTAGIGNPIIATIEVIGSILLSVMAVFIPLLAVIMVLVLLGLMVRRFGIQT